MALLTTEELFPRVDPELENVVIGGKVSDHMDTLPVGPLTQV